MKKWQSVALGIILFLLMVSCNSPYTGSQINITETATPPPGGVQTETPKFAKEIQAAQNQWKSFGINDYHLKVAFHENFANGLETERDVIVTDGNIVNSSCLSDKCPAFVLNDVFTVDDLFAVANGSTLAKLPFPPSPTFTYNDCVQELSFDNEYGFPKSMSINCPNAYDEDHSFQVVLFEVLK
jgi:hypothetical protein